MPDPHAPFGPLPERVDLAVVGGGILGAAIAHAAQAARPGSRTVVLDQGVRDTATRWSLGVLAPWANTAGQRALLERGADHVRERVEPDLVRPFLRWVSALVVASPATLDRLAAATIGTDMQTAPPGLLAQARAAYGELTARDGDTLATVCAGVAVLDVGGLAERLLADSVVHRGAQVTRVEDAGDFRTLLLADGRTLTARHVVLATGPWAQPALGADPSTSSVPTGWRTKRIAALHAARQPPADAPLVCFPDDDLFLLPAAVDETGGRGGVGASFRCEDWDVPPGPGTGVLDGRTLESGRVALARRAPDLAAEIGSGRVAVDGYTPDRTPLTGLRAPGVVQAVAASGGGARFAWGVADQVLALLAADGAGRSAGSPSPHS
ncbi:FAD-dependent oxidoreductase [Streptomyces sp. NPDC048411]|uniref:FAD-dependent oxidoreductase n=1 Tax=Streptomyces sp. NPDC048411 TaxID=3157206 RepID=UPI003456201E